MHGSVVALDEDYCNDKDNKHYKFYYKSNYYDSLPF